MIRIWGSNSEPSAQGRIKGAKPIAVLDIGSNSVRLVVYERHARALTVLYNEKASSALGRGVAATGRIAEKNKTHALRAARRFALVAKLMNVQDMHILATSAVRDAENGAEFAAEIESIMQAKVQVLSGEQEAHFAALGVVDGMPDFKGFVGDMGGGSLEISRVEEGTDFDGQTLELGVIRLQDDSDGSAEKAREIAIERLADTALVGAGGAYCAIGGTWRSLAKLHQKRQKYPLHMIQNYSVAADEMLALCNDVIAAYEAEGTYDNADHMSSSRRGLVPFGAAVMAACIEVGKLTRIDFSALGVREGYLFSRLDTQEQNVDPLLMFCEEMSVLRSRSPAHALDLIAFTANFMAGAEFEETPEDVRLRHAICHLADIAWRGHPDYRGDQAVDTIAYGSMVGIDHPGRLFIAESLAVRYMGLKHKILSASLQALLQESAHKRARMIGVLLRVAYPLSAGMPGILPHVWFSRDGKVLQLHLPQSYAFLDGDRLESRLKQLAGAARLSAGRIMVG